MHSRAVYLFTFPFTYIVEFIGHIVQFVAVLIVFVLQRGLLQGQLFLLDHVLCNMEVNRTNSLNSRNSSKNNVYVPRVSELISCSFSRICSSRIIFSYRSVSS